MSADSRTSNPYWLLDARIRRPIMPWDEPVRVRIRRAGVEVVSTKRRHAALAGLRFDWMSICFSRMETYSSDGRVLCFGRGVLRLRLRSTREWRLARRLHQRAIRRAIEDQTLDVTEISPESANSRRIAAFIQSMILGAFAVGFIQAIALIWAQGSATGHGIALSLITTSIFGLVVAGFLWIKFGLTQLLWEFYPRTIRLTAHGIDARDDRNKRMSYQWDQLDRIDAGLFGFQLVFHDGKRLRIIVAGRVRDALQHIDLLTLGRVIFPIPNPWRILWFVIPGAVLLAVVCIVANPTTSGIVGGLVAGAWIFGITVLLTWYQSRADKR